MRIDSTVEQSSGLVVDPSDAATGGFVMEIFEVDESDDTDDDDDWCETLVLASLKRKYREKCHSSDRL